MSLLEQLNKGPQPEGKRCKCAVMLASVSEEVADRVTDILGKIAQGTGEYSATWLSRTLRQTGIIINHASLLRHARKECCCHVA